MVVESLQFGGPAEEQASAQVSYSMIDPYLLGGCRLLDLTAAPLRAPDLCGRHPCLHRRIPSQWTAPLANSPHGARRGRDTRRAGPPPPAGAARHIRQDPRHQPDSGSRPARFAARVRQSCAAWLAWSGRIGSGAEVHRFIDLRYRCTTCYNYMIPFSRSNCGCPVATTSDHLLLTCWERSSDRFAYSFYSPRRI